MKQVTVRLTIDVPTVFLPALESSLTKQGLRISPYLKNGVQRWRVEPRLPSARPAIPAELIEESVVIIDSRSDGVEEAA